MSVNRTRGQAIMEVRFAVEYGELHEKFWSHVDTFISLAQVLAGALALAGAFSPGNGTVLTAAAGALLALMSGFQIAVKPRERSIQFRDTRRRAHELNSKAWEMPQRALEQALEQIRSEAPRGLEALSRPAFNRVVTMNGFPNQAEQLTAWERTVLAFT